MKLFKVMAIALLAILGLNSCSNETTPPEFIEVDYNKALVGTWTCLQDDYAEALIINADGTVVSTGVEKGEYWDGVKGNIKTVNNKMKLTFEDSDNYEGRFEMICGEAFTIFDENGEHLTYRYCENDLADEIVGMWVSTGANVDGAENVAIQTYQNDGKAYFTGGFAPEENGYETKAESTYKVIGNLMIQKMPAGATVAYITRRLTYVPNGTTYGDILICESSILGTTTSWLRIKQSLDLAKKEYDYSNVYVTNVKADDVEFDFAGQKLNFATLDGSMMDKMMRNILFNVSFPTADKFVYSCYVNDNKTSIEAPIVVDGNKITIKMSENKAVYRDIDVYTFQDVDACQMHMYMPRSSFVKFIANIGVVSMSKNGELDLNDTEAVKAVYDDIDEAIKTINVSFIFKSDK